MVIRARSWRNFIALSLIQASNALLPILIFPYALVTIGQQSYASIVVSEALALVLMAIVIYSYEIEGVNKAAKLYLAGNYKGLSLLLSEILTARMLLYIVFVSLFSLVIYVTNQDLFYLFLLWSLVPLSFAVQPGWLYQALENNIINAIIVLLSRVISVVAVYLFVKSPEDYLWIPGIVGVAYLMGAGVSLFNALRQFEIEFVAIYMPNILKNLYAGRHVFLGNLSVVLYRDLNILLLSFFGVSDSGISVYSISEKITKVFQATIRPLNQMAQPKVVKIVSEIGVLNRESFNQIWELLRPQLITLILIFLMLSLGIYLCVVGGLNWEFRGGGESIKQIFMTTMFMCIGSFFGVANFMFGSAGLNAFGEQRYLFKSILTVGCISVIIASSLIVIFGASGAVVGFVFAEVLLLLLILRRYFRSSAG